MTAVTDWWIVIVYVAVWFMSKFKSFRKQWATWRSLEQIPPSNQGYF